MVMHATGTIESFFEMESLGVMCEPRCGGCKCGRCQPGAKDMSLQEEREYQMIEEGLSFDKAKGRWIAKYPWVVPPEKLPNNRCVALAILRSTEKRLAKDPEHAIVYNEQIEDMVRRKAARMVSDRELNEYKGPQFYISHFEVLNPKSKSTPCRIVYNSSSRYQGHSLNDHLAKGPSMLNRLFGVLMRFREGKHGFIGDISKMYHSIDIPLLEQMTHLFLWRNLQTDTHPQTYAMTAVNMGDRPSATIAQVALRKSAEESAQEFPEASELLINNHYMDDIPGSTDSEQHGAQLRDDIEAILTPRGFTIKEWVCGGSEREDEIPLNIEAKPDEQQITEGVLGVKWNPRLDILKFEVGQQKEKAITKRNILSVMNAIYDPIGLLTPSL